MAALVRCSRYQPIKAGRVAQIDRAMSVYSRNKKSPAKFLAGRAGIDMARTKKPAQRRAKSIRYTYECIFY